MIRVYYDGTIFYQQKHGGISVVFKEIFKCIGKNRSFECLCTFPSNNICSDVVDIKKAYVPKIRPHRIFPFFWNLMSGFYQVRFRPHIFHGTYYSRPRAPRKVKTVLTIHDMIFERFPEDFNGSDFKELVTLKRSLAYGADAIVCVSESTKRDVVRFYADIPEAKVHVVHNGVEAIYLAPASLAEKDQFRRSLALEKPFFLYVGRLSGLYKNFQLLLEVFSSTLALHSRFDLVVISSDPFDAAHRARIANCPGNIRRFSGVGSDQLKLFYGCCLALVYPSKYEGFGIPMLEAMACGTPVLAAGISSLPEVGGDAALYFDPESKEELRERMLRIGDSNALRTELIAKGYENLKRFSWDNSVRQLEKIYADLVGEAHK